MKVNKVNTVTTKIIKSPKAGIKKAAEKLKAKEYPNWVGLPGENYGGRSTLYNIVFYPEDIEKMKFMTKEEAKAYENKLFLEHRYHEEEKKTIVFSDEFKQFMKEHNLELERFIVH